MKLNNDEEKILINWGCTKTDIEQIKRLQYKFTLYYQNGNSTKISTSSAKEKLSTEQFLSAIERSAFHKTAYREIDDNKYQGILVESNL